MTFDTTFGNLKKRVFDILYEYTSSTDTVYADEGDKLLITSKIPDAVNSSLARIYEGLPVGRAKACQRISRPDTVFCHEGLHFSKESFTQFYTDCADVGLYFRFFGSGSVTFSYEGGNTVAEISCDGGESVSVMKTTLSLGKSGTYRVAVTGNLEISDFTVYENDGTLKAGSLCGKDKAGFELPEGFGRILRAFCGEKEINADTIVISDGFGFINTYDCTGYGSIDIEYQKKADIISSDTSDSFTFDLEPLAFEALVCLTGCEVCREQDAAKHTRLMYKYNDLCEGLRNISGDKKANRNTFYKAGTRMRW